MSGRKFFSFLFRFLVCGVVIFLPLVISSFKLGKLVEDYGLWLPSAGMGLAMFVTGFWAPLVVKLLFKKYKLIDLHFVWMFGFLIGGLHWAKDYGPRLLAPDATPRDVLLVGALLLLLATCLVVGSWIGVICFAGGKETWREWMRRITKYDWIDEDDR